MDHGADLGQFLFVMTRTARHWRLELDRLLEHYGLTEARTRPLIYIDRLGDGIRQKDLAAELEIEGSSLVRLVDSLEKGGLIRRRVGKGDRRERYLHLTASGREMVLKVRKLTDKLHRHALDNLSPNQERACLSAFAAIDEALADAAERIDPVPAALDTQNDAQPTA